MTEEIINEEEVKEEAPAEEIKEEAPNKAKNRLSNTHKESPTIKKTGLQKA